MANLNIKSNNDKTIAKIDCKGIFIFNTTGCKENSIYLILQGVKKILYI